MVITGFFYRRILDRSCYPMKGRSVLLFTGMGKEHKGMAVLYPYNNLIWDRTIIKDQGIRKEAATFRDGYVLPWQKLMAEANKKGTSQKIKSSLYNLVTDEEVRESDLVDSCGMPFVRIAVSGNATGFVEVKDLTTVASKVLVEKPALAERQEEALDEAAVEALLADALG